MEVLTKILSAAVDMFRQYGFKTITMDDVARRAGISKKTLYQHFANKNEVVIESITWYKSGLMEQCSELMTVSENAIEAIVRVMAMFDKEHSQMNPMAILELERFFPEGYKKFKQSLLDQDVVVIKENLQRGIAEGCYRPELNIEIMARYRMELSMLQMQPNLMLNNRYDLPFIARELDEHFLYGIMTPKGEKLYQKYKEQYILKGVSKL